MELSPEFQFANPFPFIVTVGLLSKKALRLVEREFLSGRRCLFSTTRPIRRSQRNSLGIGSVT